VDTIYSKFLLIRYKQKR